MALDNVTKEIIVSAETKAGEIRSRQTLSVMDIKADTDAKIAKTKAMWDKKIAEEINILDRQERSSYELEGKKMILSKKKEILEEAFDSTLQNLKDLSNDKKLEQYRMMIASAESVISQPKVIMSEDDMFTAKQLGVSSVEKDRMIDGGIILQNEEGIIEVDMQYKTILQNIWDGNLKKLSDILFG